MHGSLAPGPTAAVVKDYQDIAALIRANSSLSKGLASARLMYGQDFQPSEALKAMVYFEGDLELLSLDDQETLVKAASEVRLLPLVTIASRRLCATVKGLT